MKSRMLFVLATALLMFAGTANAGTSNFAGTLSVQLGSLAPASVGTNVGVATTNQMNGGTHVTTLTVPTGPTASDTTTTLAGYTVKARVGAGNFAGIVPGSSASTLGPVVAAGGNIQISVDAAGSLSETLSLAPTTSATAGSHGVNSVNWTAHVVSGWTVGTAHGPASLASTVALGDSSGSPGVIQLVAAVSISSDLPSGPTPLALTSTYRLVPEPGMALLIVSGAAGLALLGWRRS